MILLNVRERHLSSSHELPIALALLTTRLRQSMAEVVAEVGHGVVGAEGGLADLQGGLVVGTGAGQIAQVGGTVPRLLCRVAMLGWSAP